MDNNARTIRLRKGKFGSEAIEMLFLHQFREVMGCAGNTLQQIFCRDKIAREQEIESTSSGLGNISKRWHRPHCDWLMMARFAPIPVSRFVEYMKKGDGSNADRVRKRLAEMVKSESTQSPYDICEYAETLIRMQNYTEAILFFQIARTNFEMKENKLEIYRFSLDCVHGLTFCILRVYERNMDKKQLLKKYVIPWLDKALSIARKACKNDKGYAMAQALVMTFQSSFHYQFLEHSRTKILLRKVMKLIEKHFKSEAKFVALHSLCRFNWIVVQFYECDEVGFEETSREMESAIASLKRSGDIDAHVKYGFLQLFNCARQMINCGLHCMMQLLGGMSEFMT